jgi:hypothetical protein
LLLAACVVVYFFLSAVYQYYTWYIEKDYIFLSKPLVRLDTAAGFGGKHWGARLTALNICVLTHCRRMGQR